MGRETAMAGSRPSIPRASAFDTYAIWRSPIALFGREQPSAEKVMLEIFG